MFGKFFNINRIVWYLTLSDVLTWGVYMIINGFIGIYIARKITQDAEIVLGIGVAIFYFAKGTLQIPIGLVTDRIKHNFD
ncbi:MAG: hypothetical protein NZZ41_02530, partial [Candidatus Dojkabacteria bacterium]|nr:hypothetical protein [Candidatus Dojkabacteria bacterium]